MLSIWNDAFHATGGNEFVGRSLAYCLQSVGAESVTMKVHVEVAQIGEYRRTHLLSLIDLMRGSCGRHSAGMDMARRAADRVRVVFGLIYLRRNAQQFAGARDVGADAGRGSCPNMLGVR